MTEFDVRIVATEQIEDVFVAVLVGEDVNEERLELQRTRSFDEQDIALHQDTYCLVSAQGNTSYGGVSSCLLNAGVLEVRLNGKGRADLYTDGFRLALRLQALDMVKLRAALSSVFAGEDASVLRLD